MTPPQRTDPVTLEPFFERVRVANPFTNNRVNGASPADVDVDQVHQGAFERLPTLALEALGERRGLGTVLWGEAGIGKSHLLSRLARWAGQDERACFVYLHNLQASPANLPRSLLKAVVSVLTRGQVRNFHQTPLYDLTFAFLREAAELQGARRHLPWPRAERAFHDLVDRLGEDDRSRAALADRSVYTVLFNFFYSAYRLPKTGDETAARLAVRWLSGDALDPEEARELGLPPGRGRDEPAALADNQQVKQVLVALTRLAVSRGQPFLLCFDQVDNLEDDQGAALSRFLEALIDSAPNLLVVTAGVQASLLGWRNAKVIQDSAWDRLAQFAVPLQRVTPAEGRRIVAARLAAFLEPFRGLDDIGRCRDDDPLFPLGRAWADDFFGGKIDLRPRDAINGAREAWRREQEALRQLGGPAWLATWPHAPAPAPASAAPALRDVIDQKVAQKLAAHIEERRLHSESLPPDADNLAGLLAALLRHAGPSLTIERPPLGLPDRQFPFHFVVRRPLGEGETRTGVLCLATDSATSATALLRWLTQEAQPVDRIVLVTEERCPLAFGRQPEAKGRQYYEALRRGEHGTFRHMEVKWDEYAHLEALQAVVGMARSGDLEIEWPLSVTRGVGEAEVVESYTRQGRYEAVPLLRYLRAATGELSGVAGMRGGEFSPAARPR